MVFYARVYGLTIRADQPIPGLRFISEPSEEVDLDIRFNTLPDNLKSLPTEKWVGHSRFHSRHPYDQGNQPRLIIMETEDGEYVRLSYVEDVQFTYDKHATQLWVTYPDKWTLEQVSRYLLSPVLCFGLRLREIVCLHACAIEVDGRAILIAGESGAGKSTTASYFALRHHSILSDDVSVFLVQNSNIYVQPGYSLLRLWPTSVKALFGDEDSLPSLTMDWDKRYLDLNTEGLQFAEQPLPVGAVYIFRKRSETLSIKPIETPQALLELMNNTYLDYLLDKRLRAVDMKVIAQMVTRIPVRELTPSNDLDQLADLYEAILRDYRMSIGEPERG